MAGSKVAAAVITIAGTSSVASAVSAAGTVRVPVSFHFWVEWTEWRVRGREYEKYGIARIVWEEGRNIADL